MEIILDVPFKSYKLKINLINKKVSEYKFFKILFFLCLLLLIIASYSQFDIIQLLDCFAKDNFDDMFPRINSKDYKINNKDELFKNRELFISNQTITNKYIKFIRPISFGKETFNISNIGIEPDLSFVKKRSNIIKVEDYYNLCRKNILILNETFINSTISPLISVIIIAYNKKNIILNSIRSIQNQSLKNIEIIIVDDHSTDNSSVLFHQLLNSDGRIRLFTHLYNMGAWRSRLDGFLYSKAPYVIHFDAGDFYADNYVLEDIYNIANKYKLDSVRFGFRLTRSQNSLTNRDKNYFFSVKDRKIFYGKRYYSIYGYRYGTIWNRLTRADIFTKGLYHLDEYILNAYKNIFEDRWWNSLANNESNSFLMTNRIGYIYLKDSKGQGHIRNGNAFINDKTIKEIILFFLFDYNLAYERSDKSNIIKNLKDFKRGKRHLKLSHLKSYFPPYVHLLNMLINDKYVSPENKLFLFDLKKEYKFYK